MRAPAFVRWSLAALLIAILVAGTRSAWRSGESEDRVWSITLSPTARYVCVLSDSGASIYEPAEGARALHHVAGGRDAAFSGDGRRCAVAVHPDIVVLDLTAPGAAGPAPRRLDAGIDWNTTLAFAPDGRSLASLAEQSSVLRLWDLETGKLRWEADAHEDADFGLAFRSDGRVVATGGSSANAQTCEVRLWSSEDGRPLGTITIDRHAYVRGIHFLDHDRTLLVEASDGRSNVLFDLRDPERIAERADHPLAGLHGAVVFAPDGRHVVAEISTGDVWSQAVGVYEVETGRQVLGTPGSPGLWWGAAFVADRAQLALATSFGRVGYWGLDDGALHHEVRGIGPSSWSKTWTALLAALGVWTVLWLSSRRVIARRPDQPDQPDPGATLWVPVVAVVASLFIVLLHWIAIADPPTTPDPIDFVGGLAVAELLALVVLILATSLSRAWVALVVAAIAFPALLITTVATWFALVASV